MRIRVALACAVVLLSGCSGEPPEQDARPSEPSATTPEPGATTGSRGDGGRSTDVDPALAPALAGEPALPRHPRQAARQLAAADQALRDPDTPAPVLAAAGHTQQLAVRALADRAGWDRRVSALLPPRVGRDTVDNVTARRTFRSMFPDDASDLADEVPAWRIVRPRPADELRGHFREAERRYGVDWEYLAAINLVETAFGRIDATSVAGAQGPMQFIPTTWDIYGEGGDITDPRDAILAAGRLLQANGFAEDRAGALYRYNNSEAYVRGVTAHARVMQRTAHAYRGYHQWPVYYLTRQGAVWLPEGYDEPRPVPVSDYLSRRS
jgi:membrane-bound lytic murein transglycosylase B